MKLNKIYLDKKITSEKGISEIRLDRLNNVVALVGKNGSGKTRFLDLIEQNLESLINVHSFLDGSISNPPKILESLLDKLLPHKEYIFLSKKVKVAQLKVNKFPNDDKLRAELIEVQNQQNNLINKYHQPAKRGAPDMLHVIASLLKSSNEIISTIYKNYIRKIKYEDVIQLQDSIPDNRDAKLLTFESLIEGVAENVDYNAFTSIYQSSLEYLVKLPHQLVDDYMDCNGDSSKYEKRISHKRFISLKKLCSNFLNKELTWKKEKTERKITEEGVQTLNKGLWLLDDRLFNYIELSDGEKTLFSYILLFFLIELNPDLTISENILIIDEPELHLHPDSEIDLIQGIRKTLSNKGQLFIATHSINILSDLNLDEIYMVSKGFIAHPSRKTLGQSLAELMSIDERIVKLQNFLTSASEWTYINFMTQCLSEPDVLAHSSKDDPQYVAFKNALNRNVRGKSNLLLDFGAGKGRFYELLNEETELDFQFHYSALEREKKYHKQLTNLGIKNIFHTYKELTEAAFDFILLCNVLHEIPLNEWVSVLNSIANSLNETGYLIIIEDKLLPKGEKIGEIGYLILDNDSIKELFGLDQPLLSFADKTNAERILCSVIPKKQMSKVNNNMLIDALKILKVNSLNKIKELRKNNSNVDINDGRINGFYSQQYINSILGIDFLTKEK